jgi:C-terminal processing protease CtpA/Prc
MSKRLLLITGLILLVLLICIIGAYAQDKKKSDIYQKDVEFLLKELEKQCGHFFKIKNINWEKVREQFTAEVKNIKDDVVHIELCECLIAQLRDGHACLKDIKVKMPESPQEKWVGPGMFWCLKERQIFVKNVWGPAKESGVTEGMEIMSVDNKNAWDWLMDVVEERSKFVGCSTVHSALFKACHWGLKGPSQSKLTLTVKDINGKIEMITVTRNISGGQGIPIGPVFPPKCLKTIKRQSYGKTDNGFGYIQLRDVPEELSEQLDTMLGDIGDVLGLILDMRANGGGACDHEAVFGRFLKDGAGWGQYKGVGKVHYTGPMVVIVDAGTFSSGETVSGMFKEDGRAYMIGESATSGSSSQKTTLEVPSGFFKAYFSVKSNKNKFNNGRGIEGIGVPPNEIVYYDPKDLANGIDTLIKRAEELLQKGFPKNSVRYQNK